MIPDVYALVRRDHDDLDRGLAAMVDPMTPAHELGTLLDVVKLALAVHVAAETSVFRPLLATPSLQRVAAEARHEHARQQAALDLLALARPASDTWYARALELRVLVLDHAQQAELVRWVLQDHVPAPVLRRLAADYATERMRVLARTSPLLLARERLALQNPRV